MIILLAVLALVVVNALQATARGASFTIARDDPDRAADGLLDDADLRPGACSRRRSIGVVLLLARARRRPVGRRSIPTLGAAVHAGAGTPLAWA